MSGEGAACLEHGDVGRFFAWIGNKRRVLIRRELHREDFLGFAQIACVTILVKYF